MSGTQENLIEKRVVCQIGAIVLWAILDSRENRSNGISIDIANYNEHL